MANNELETLPENLFDSHVQSLQRIILTNNRLHFIPDRLFSKQNALTELRLSHNFLTTFHSQAIVCKFHFMFLALY